MKLQGVKRHVHIVLRSNGQTVSLQLYPETQIELEEVSLADLRRALELRLNKKVEVRTFRVGEAVDVLVDSPPKKTPQRRESGGRRPR